jgi:MFS family permease
MPAAPAPTYMPGLASPFEAERSKQINRTKTGILLLLIGTLISWIPYYAIGAIGGFLVLVGAILVILGRKAFGPKHSRNVMISILLFFVGIIIGVVAVSILTSALLAGIFGGTPSQAAVQSALNNYLILLAASAIVGGLASVFFTFELQNKIGRYLLFAGYAANVIIGITLAVVVGQVISTIMSAAFPGGTYNATAAIAALADFSARVSALALLSVIPALIYAAANYLVWSRINRGEIPGPTTPPGMPTMAPPAPPR